MSKPGPKPRPKTVKPPAWVVIKPLNLKFNNTMSIWLGKRLSGDWRATTYIHRGIQAIEFEHALEAELFRARWCR